MRILIQRALNASCKVDDNITGKIDHGYVIFVGYTDGDDEKINDKLISKLIGLRIFEDENHKLNKSIKDVNGEILAISQFTLYADSKHGNRPSFTKALAYDEANKLYISLCNKIRENGIKCEMGIFGADMKISLINDGPVTIMLDSKEL